MSWLEYRNGVLHAEDVRVQTLADRFATPLYVYSKAGIERNLKAYQEAMEGRDGLICYAVKANSNLGLLNLLAGLGAGFDIVSGGELDRVLKAGADPTKIVFSGVGKQEWEIEKALAAKIFCFNVESESELKLIRSMAAERGLTGIPLSLRVNPDVDAQTHPYISTGLRENKFGIELEIAEKIYLEYRNDPIISWKGVDCHIGSQLTDLGPFKDAFEIILKLVDRLFLEGIKIEHVDMGGGLGVSYDDDDKPPSPSEYLEQILPEIRKRNLKLVVEPGRSIIADAGLLLTKVLYLKSNKIKNFAVVDAAMNDLIRPSLYNAHHQLVHVYEDLDEDEAEQKSWDIVGPVCETGDFLAKNRILNLQEGDTLAILSTGAYGSSMSSQYNSRGRSAEILVDKNRARLIRRRETVEDLYANEIILSASNDI